MKKVIGITLLLTLCLGCIGSVMRQVTEPTQTPPPPESDVWVTTLEGYGRTDLFWIKDGERASQYSYSGLTPVLLPGKPAVCRVSKETYRSSYNLHCLEVEGMITFTFVAEPGLLLAPVE